MPLAKGMSKRICYGQLQASCRPVAGKVVAGTSKTAAEGAYLSVLTKLTNTIQGKRHQSTNDNYFCVVVKDFDSIVMPMTNMERGSFTRETFTLVSGVAFCRDGDGYVPAEISVIGYNINGGVQEVFHRLVAVPLLPAGALFEAEKARDEIHGLPLPPNALGERESTVYKQLLEHLGLEDETEEGVRTLYAWDGEYAETSRGVVRALAAAAAKATGKAVSCPLKVQPLSSLLPVPAFGAHLRRELTRDPYGLHAGIACATHGAFDVLVAGCALSHTHRLAFAAARVMCPAAGIELVTSVHLPLPPPPRAQPPPPPPRRRSGDFDDDDDECFGSGRGGRGGRGRRPPAPKPPKPIVIIDHCHNVVMSVAAAKSRTRDGRHKSTFAIVDAPGLLAEACASTSAAAGSGVVEEVWVPEGARGGGDRGRDRDRAPKARSRRADRRRTWSVRSDWSDGEHSEHARTPDRARTPDSARTPEDSDAPDSGDAKRDAKEQDASGHAGLAALITSLRLGSAAAQQPLETAAEQPLQPYVAPLLDDDPFKPLCRGIGRARIPNVKGVGNADKPAVVYGRGLSAKLTVSAAIPGNTPELVVDDKETLQGSVRQHLPGCSGDISVSLQMEDAPDEDTNFMAYGGKTPPNSAVNTPPDPAGNMAGTAGNTGDIGRNDANKAKDSPNLGPLQRRPAGSKGRGQGFSVSIPHL